MDTKHAFTPGPWFSVDYSGFWTVQYEPGYEPATDVFDEERCDSAEANCRLAASAPELLSALEEMVGLCDLFDKVWFTKPQQESITKAKEAIKKAIGE